MYPKKIEKQSKNLMIIVFINLIIFGVTNILFDIKYEQVDDFIIYNLYSGLDGTYNIHGIYIHPVICFIISIFFRIIPQINWHTIFLLAMQFICFTAIGYTILKKHNNGKAIILYTIFTAIFYPTLLMLIQYTSVSALLILTSLILIIDQIEQNEKSRLRNLIIIFILYAIGIMTRMQSLLIIAPFFGIYYLINLVKYKFKKTIKKEKILRLTKYYIIYTIITITIYISSIIIYNSDEVYKNYMEYNDIRATLNDIIYVDYEENKEIFDEIGWSKNDHYLFYTFNFGDEKIYSKENLQKILDYKIQKDGKYNYDINLAQLQDSYISEMQETNTYIAIIFIGIYIVSLFNKEKKVENTIIFLTTIAIHMLFIIIGRSMLRVVIPEYIIGTALMIYNINLGNKEIIQDNIKNCIIIIFMIMIITMFSGEKYKYGYELENYENYKELINYTNNNKQNVYLYTVPSLQDRYLTYSVYEMPPKGAFSNLRVLGGWDMFTGNYFDFKDRYELDGTFLDLLKTNVYLVDGDVVWSGVRYKDYKANIALAIKEHYGVDVEFETIEKFGNLTIYKVVESSLNFY